VQLVDGSGNITGWKYTIADNDEVETYNADGTLASLTSRAGLTQTMTYDGNDRLSLVTERFPKTPGELQIADLPTLVKFAIRHGITTTE